MAAADDCDPVVIIHCFIIYYTQGSKSSYGLLVFGCGKNTFSCFDSETLAAVCYRHIIRHVPVLFVKHIPVHAFSPCQAGLSAFGVPVFHHVGAIKLKRFVLFVKFVKGDDTHRFQRVDIYR